MMSERANVLIEQIRPFTHPEFFRGTTRPENVDSLCSNLLKLGQLGSPETIYWILGFLYFPDRFVRNAAQQALEGHFRNLPLDQLSSLPTPSACRTVSVLYWIEISPQGLRFLIDQDPNHSKSSVAILAAACYHSNGYVRHEAIRQLARNSDGNELPFLIVRMFDWVDQIAQDAIKAVSDRIREDYRPHFVKCFSLLTKMQLKRRRNLSDIVQQIINLITDADSEDDFRTLLLSENVAANRRSAKLLASQQGRVTKRFVQTAIESGDSLVRLYACNAAHKLDSSTYQNEVYLRLRQDKSSQVRRECLRALAELSPEMVNQIWTSALLDSNSSIRNLAQYSLSVLGDVSALSFYRQALTQSPNCLPAAQGLAEIGNSEDLTIFLNLIHHPKSRFRAAGVSGLLKTDPIHHISTFLSLLDDPCTRVIRSAEQALQEHIPIVEGSELLKRFVESDQDKSSFAALRLIFNMGKWQSLPWLLRGAADAPPQRATEARHQIKRWFSPPLSHCVWTHPTHSDRDEIRRMLKSHARKLPKELVELVSVRLEESS